MTVGSATRMSVESACLVRVENAMLRCMRAATFALTPPVSRLRPLSEGDPGVEEDGSAVRRTAVVRYGGGRAAVSMRTSCTSALTRGTRSKGNLICPTD